MNLVMDDKQVYPKLINPVLTNRVVYLYVKASDVRRVSFGTWFCETYTRAANNSETSKMKDMVFDDALVAIDHWLNFHGYTTTLPEPVTKN